MIANILIFIRDYLDRLEEPAGAEDRTERPSYLAQSAPSGAWEKPQGEELTARVPEVGELVAALRVGVPIRWVYLMFLLTVSKAESLETRPSSSATQLLLFPLEKVQVCPLGREMHPAPRRIQPYPTS